MKRLLIPLCILLAASFLTLSSVSRGVFYRQLGFAAAGFIFLFLFDRFEWRKILSHPWFARILYGFGMLLLVAVLFIGPVIRGVRSWLVLGPLSFQPAELMKAALILMFAEYFSRRHLSIARWKVILTSFALFIFPAMLTGLQPALGSALVFFGIWFGFLLSSGLPKNRLAVTLAAFAVAGFFMWHWGLHDYQKARIEHFFYPEKNVLGANYSVAQSKIAIGSAGWWGKGYGQGSQTQLGFLTEPTNDFILAAFIEEWGIIGGAVLIAAFLWLIWAILRIGFFAENNFDKFVCLGTAITLGIQFFLNSGSALGLVPVVGLPFPFFSYGGSALLVGFFLLAIIGAADKR
jgi:rod shape determining protein RodA